MQAHLGADARDRLGQKVSRPHPGLERSERMLDGLSAQLRGFWGAVKPFLHTLQNIFVFPASNSAIFTRCALRFQFALRTCRGPVLVVR